jgi:PIN domain nuclease of toxin-antitoxin system
MLLDTHTLIWFLNDDTKLSGNTKAIIEDGDNLFVSIISIWEIAIKINVGKLNIDIEFEDLSQILAELDIQILQFDFVDTEIYIGLPLHHRDPFDRILIAQAIHHNLVIVGCDVTFDAYPIKRLWE